MTTRRGFLKDLFKGGALAGAAAVGSTSTVLGLDAGLKKKEETAFNFMCLCDRCLIAKVPANTGDKVKVECDCGRVWDMVWQGDHFNTHLADQSAAWYGNRRQEMI